MGDVGSNGGECGCGDGFADFWGIWRDVGGYLLNLQIEIQQSLRFGMCWTFIMVTFKAVTACMNRKYISFCALALTGALTFMSCNTDSGYDVEPIDYSGVALKGFSLKSDDKVLNNLDSVFFSIDLNTAQVFNANPLPMGTDVSALAVSLSYDACSEAKLYEPSGEEGVEPKEINYLEDADSKINFTNGPVRLHLVSADGTNRRDYYLKVNVSDVKTDSLCWGDMAFAVLPGTFRPTAQKTVKMGGKAYCLTSDGSSYCLSVSDDPYADSWQSRKVDFPGSVDVRSLTATNSELFILDASGALLKSADGYAWSDTGCRWAAITATYCNPQGEGSGDRLLGLRLDGGKYYHTSYPAAAEAEAAADFPVGGNSATVVFESKWSDAPQVMTVGGRTADGALSGDTWAYDGQSWVKLSAGLPEATGYAVTPYVISETDTISWRVKESDVLLAFGGRTAKEINRTVYLSRDYGVTWKKADQLLQLPKEMPTVYDADAIVFEKLLTLTDPATVKGRWRKIGLEVPLNLNAGGWVAASRAVKPITEWECPYLYMWGGVESDGALSRQVWRGVVNHLSFRPLQ